VNKSLFWLTKWFRQEQWNIGLVGQSIDDIVSAGITKPIQWLTPLEQGFLADPYAQILPDGQLEILAEQFDFQSFKGVIVSTCANIDQAQFAKFEVSIESKTHLSYPQVIFWENEQLLLCENWEQCGIPIFSRKDSKSPWEYKTTILKHLRPIDPTPYFHEGVWFLFFTLQNQFPNQELHLMYSQNPLFGWKMHPQAIINNDRNGARPAGPIYKMNDGRLIRPGQNNTTTYGGGITLYEIQKISTTEYREEKVCALDPQKGNWQWGLHTLCPINEHWSLVDGKRWLISYKEIFRKLRRQLMLRKRRILPAPLDGV